MKKKLIFIVLTLFIFTSCSSVPVGNVDTYTATAAEMLGVTMSPEDVSEGGITLALDENGNGTLKINGQSHNVKWEVSGTKFTLSQGSDVFEGTMEGNTVKIINLLNMGLDITFVKDGESDTQTSSEKDDVSSEDTDASSENIDNGDFVAPGFGAEKTISVETLSNPSKWYGEMTISGYEGSGENMDGDYEIWAYLNTTSDEMTYFEIYADGPIEDIDSVLFLSFLTEEHDYTFFPVVDDYSFIWNAPVKEEDNTWFTPTLTNGILSASYDYDYDGVKFNFVYQLAQVEESETTLPEEVESSQAESSETESSESTVESSQAVSDKKYTIDELREIFLTIENADEDVRSLLTYEEMVSIYFDGVGGEIQYDDPDFKSYLWRSQEDETAYVYISYEIDDSGVINYLSMSMSNIGRDG